MTTQVQFSTFNFKNLPVRVIADPNSELWFCGTDVCDILGYVNAPDALSKHCKEAGIAKRYISHSSGKKSVIFINEPNLYRLIIKSRKPEAEPFEAWVFEEVLPQIRKTGSYSLQPQQLALPEPEKKFTIELTEYELQQMAWLWFIALRANETFQVLHPALKAIGSHYAATVYDQAHEYRPSIRECHKIVSKMTAQFDYDRNSNWRVLEHIKGYNPRTKAFQLSVL
ncbi:hypothetical protein FHQ28_05435 [Pasteurellaceae bacterium USgator11]|nr:hypothetical protein FHQ19_09360 [Pasteurellaceae bacterium UScroc12]TNG94758.1 hypothetical protein FHQ20_08175 [Pasteurellaceae bacterium USgator41]TNG97729.1 hypothetical protein FHQ24_09965 [Pasteurellaceae bacterium UScroc31]TNH01690.1 hypothetical protein FHQ28_05435 [Pasteurellaceae bacterium USgator11]